MTDGPDRITRRQTLAAILAAGMVPALAKGARAADADFAAFNAAYAKNLVLPAFVAMSEAASKLADAAQKACSGGTDIEALKAPFNQFADAWASAQQFRTGPLADGQRAERISYWPERRNIVEKQLSALLKSNDAGELEGGRFASASVAIQGLPALERIVFADAGADIPSRRCAVAAAIALNLKNVTAEAEAGWRTGLANPALFAENPAEAATQSYTNLLTILQIVADQKLGVPLGADAAGAKPKSAEQWRSGRSLRNIRFNLATARNAVLSDSGFSMLLPADQQPLKEKLSKAFDGAIEAAEKAGDDLAGAVAAQDQRKPITNLLVKVNLLRDQLRQKVPPAIGITLGFNELDGDGS